FTGKSSFRRPAKILRANLYPGPTRSPDRGLQVNEGRADYDLAIFRPLDKRPKALKERRRAGSVLVHLPVSTDHRCSHMSSLCKPRCATSDRRLKCRLRFISEHFPPCSWIGLFRHSRLDKVSPESGNKSDPACAQERRNEYFFQAREHQRMTCGPHQAIPL